MLLYPYTSNSFKLLQDPLNLQERSKSASPTVWFTFSAELYSPHPPSIPSSNPVGVGSSQKLQILSFLFFPSTLHNFIFIWLYLIATIPRQISSISSSLHPRFQSYVSFLIQPLSPCRFIVRTPRSPTMKWKFPWKLHFPLIVPLNLNCVLNKRQTQAQYTLIQMILWCT